jgi:hypothetical protein
VKIRDQCGRGQLAAKNTPPLSYPRFAAAEKLYNSTKREADSPGATEALAVGRLRLRRLTTQIKSVRH